MRNLKEKKVKVTTEGQVIEYASIKNAAEAMDINYQTMYRWANGYNKPSIEIKVELVK